MKEWFLFFAGLCSGGFMFSVFCLFREVYGDRQQSTCSLCEEASADGYDEDLGPVCAKCECELSEVGARLMKLSNKL